MNLQFYARCLYAINYTLNMSVFYFARSQRCLWITCHTWLRVAPCGTCGMRVVLIWTVRKILQSVKFYVVLLRLIKI